MGGYNHLTPGQVINKIIANEFLPAKKIDPHTSKPIPKVGQIKILLVENSIFVLKAI